MPDLNCTYTHLKNVSGATRYFGYLPTHGRTLTAGQTITIAGDLASYFLSPGGRVNQRKLAAFEADVTANRIEIIRTPAPIFYDSTAGRTRTIGVDSGSVTVADPCYGSYVGSA